MACNKYIDRHRVGKKEVKSTYGAKCRAEMRSYPAEIEFRSMIKKAAGRLGTTPIDVFRLGVDALHVPPKTISM